MWKEQIRVLLGKGKRAAKKKKESNIEWLQQKTSVEVFQVKQPCKPNGLERNNSFKCMFTQYVGNKLLKQLNNCYLSIGKNDWI